MKDLSHPNNELFSFLQSGKRFCFLKANTYRMRSRQFGPKGLKTGHVKRALPHPDFLHSSKFAHLQLHFIVYLPYSISIALYVVHISAFYLLIQFVTISV